MASAEPAPSHERCSVHPDRSSVGRCEECGRPACLACAVPFRGRLLCTTCASQALGTSQPIERSAPRTSLGAAFVVGGLLWIALLATVPPWHHSGTLTGIFTAWRPDGELPVLLTVAATLIAAVVFVVAATLRRLPGTVVVSVAGLSLVAAGSTAFSLLRAPDFYAFTPAPFVTLAGSTVAMVAALVGLALRSRAPRTPP